jgi:hypothetical protein
VLDESEIEDWSVTEVTATDALILLDLRTAGPLRWASARTQPEARNIRKGRD